jgi:hypothetical protein
MRTPFFDKRRCYVDCLLGAKPPQDRRDWRYAFSQHFVERHNSLLMLIAASRRRERRGQRRYDIPAATT